MPTRLCFLAWLPLFIAAGKLALAQEPGMSADWKKHVIFTGAPCATAVAGDFTKDGKRDVIANAGGHTRLLVAPDWKEVILDRNQPIGLIHSEAMDVDGDGDLDFSARATRRG
jgi:hypothetical protein